MEECRQDVGAAAPTKPSQNHLNAQQRGVLATVFAATIIGSFMGSAINLSITSISSDFQAGVTSVTWIVNIFTLFAAVSCVPLGHLGDISDRRTIFLVSTALFALCSLGCALAPTLQSLIFLRAIQSIAAGGISAVGVPLLLGCTPPSMRGRMLGYSVTAVYLGLSLGPVIGGMMNTALGWRSIFFLSFLLPALSLFLGARYIQHEPRSENAGHDLLGNALYALMIASALMGLSLWSQGWWAWALVGAGIVLLGCFVLVELHAEHPAVQVRLFAHDASYSLSSIAALMSYGATFAISYTMSIYLQNVLGLSSSLAGIVLICQPIVQTAVSPFAGRLSDRIAPYKLASLGMGINAVGLLLFSTVTATTPIIQVIVNLILMGAGFGLFSSPNTNAVLSCVDKQHLGEANAILSAMRSLGMSVSMVIVLAVFGGVVGNVVVADAPADSLVAAIHIAMLVFAVICMVGTAISLVRRRAMT